MESQRLTGPVSRLEVRTPRDTETDPGGRGWAEACRRLEGEQDENGKENRPSGRWETKRAAVLARLEAGSRDTSVSVSLSLCEWQEGETLLSRSRMLQRLREVTLVSIFGCVYFSLAIKSYNVRML